MSSSERFPAGFALAATIAKDPGATAARSGLAEGVADAMTRTARELVALRKTERRARIRALTEPPVHTPSSPTSAALAPHAASAGARRALGLLAHQRGGGTAPGWLHDLPLPRPGYSPEPPLTALLARIAARMQREAE